MPHEHNLLFQADSNQSTTVQVVLCELCYFRGWSNMALIRDRRRVTFKAEIWKLVGIHTRNSKKEEVELIPNIRREWLSWIQDGCPIIQEGQ
jgi:hypothetical protein